MKDKAVNKTPKNEKVNSKTGIAATYNTQQKKGASNATDVQQVTHGNKNNEARNGYYELEKQRNFQIKFTCEPLW